MAGALIMGVVMFIGVGLLIGCPDNGGNGGNGGNPADRDGDLLIDVSTLEALNNVRYNLSGTSYKTSADDAGVKCGANADTDCIGYELTRSLDFADGGSYASEDINTAWRPSGGDPATATNGGFQPIGSGGGDMNCSSIDDNEPFATRFMGNGYAIDNLYIRNADGRGAIGLFGRLDEATIVGVGIENANIFGGDEGEFIGALAGYALRSTMVANYVYQGRIDGGDGGDSVGGLLGGSEFRVFVIGSYSTGTINGGAGTDRVGGIVGSFSNQVSIVANYFDGTVDGGAGDSDEVGGIMGAPANDSDLVVASYVSGTIQASGSNNDLGEIIGQDIDLSGRHIYYFGMAIPSVVSGGTPLPPNVSEPQDLDALSAGATWNQASSNTMGAWDFGTSSQPPALRYADYDGDGDAYACSTAENPPADTIIIPSCGMLLNRQR